MLAAVRLLLAPPESVGLNATAGDFTQVGEPHKERRVRQVADDTHRSVVEWQCTVAVMDIFAIRAPKAVATPLHALLSA